MLGQHLRNQLGVTSMISAAFMRVCALLSLRSLRASLKRVLSGR